MRWFIALAPTLLLAALALAACGARSSLRVPGLGGGGSGGSSAMGSASSTGTGCVSFPALPVLEGTVRDFSDTHPDFEKFIGDDPGMLETTLGDDGEPVYAHPDGTTLTSTGKADFDEWYHDTPSINMSAPLTLPLHLVIGGLAFDSSEFFPIDGQLLGGEDRPHNFHFTVEAHIHFRYKGGEVFRLEGDDDLWAFIDRRLAIDLGGVHSTEGREIAIDDLGLTQGTRTRSTSSSPSATPTNPTSTCISSASISASDRGADRVPSGSTPFHYRTYPLPAASVWIQ